jgi:hypothetical protein
MRRLISMLAAGLLAAGTVLATAGAASAGATAVHRQFTCTDDGSNFFNVTKSGVNYFLGTPNITFSGATARLKPRGNSTTLWLACFSSTSNTVVLKNRGLALTSRAFSPGADVTMVPPGNGGNGFASQQWDLVVSGSTVTFQNVKTGLFLRVRNSGPIMGQTVTTGFTATAWSEVSGGTWGKAMEVPGTAALNAGGNATLTSVSCASAGHCSAGGWYADSPRSRQAFVVSQVNGTWGTAKEVPGTATLNTGGDATLTSVSCASAGNCSAGGGYLDGRSGSQAFVVSQVNGTWGTAKEVPGTAALNTGRVAAITSVSCASAGNCSAGGGYLDGSGHSQAFVVSQVNGTWGTAREVPGTAALNAGNDAINSVSCGSAGNCSAGGYYKDSSGHRQAFVVSEVNGTWGKAMEVPGTATLNAGGNAIMFSVSCASAGNCSAGGGYTDSSGRFLAFVVSRAGGTWGTAEEVPGTAALNTGEAAIYSVSCASAGNCSAGGQYTDSSGHTQAFVVSQVNGTWGKAKEVPGTAALNTGGDAAINSVSCASAGNCSAGGGYESSGHSQVFVVSQVNGTWGKAKEVPGTATLNQGPEADLNSVSCGSPGHCSAGGSYTDSSSGFQAFVVSQA